MQIAISSIDKIDSAARQLVDILGSRRKVAFFGEMGAGKTTLIQAVCKVLGVEDTVASPTFALINEYFTKEGVSVYHFDLFRIEDISEMYDLGYEDYFYSDAYCFIEWPEKVMELIPEDVLMLEIKVMDDGCRVVRNR
ncbi:MAG: tRNA (adenosine(37)-N6)-threonylcarbamoyltransferase complex ATPase subunit type 1 TsaE [Bacteroidales bacterium]